MSVFLFTESQLFGYDFQYAKAAQVIGIPVEGDIAAFGVMLFRTLLDIGVFDDIKDHKEWYILGAKDNGNESITVAFLNPAISGEFDKRNWSVMISQAEYERLCAELPTAERVGNSGIHVPKGTKFTGKLVQNPNKPLFDIMVIHLNPVSEQEAETQFRMKKRKI